ncbi:hypothetical protein V6N13_095087 [Hibiscus sabdariffa]
MFAGDSALFDFKIERWDVLMNLHTAEVQHGIMPIQGKPSTLENLHALLALTTKNSSSSHKPAHNPPTEFAMAHQEQPSENVLEIFGRIDIIRTSLIQTLTTGRASLLEFCQPGDKGLCLKGPNAEWVRPPLPDPMNGINLLRDVMEEDAWLELVAISSDLWILELAFVYGATTYNITQEERVALYGLITGAQSIAEALHEWNELQVFDQLGDLPPQPAAQQMGLDELGGPENLGGKPMPDMNCSEFQYESMKINEKLLRSSRVCSYVFTLSCVQLRPPPPPLLAIHRRDGQTALVAIFVLMHER